MGISEAEIRLLTAGQALGQSTFTAAEQATLRSTCEMYRGLAASGPNVDELRALLGPAALTELVVLIGLYVGMVRILSTLEVDVEPEYDTFLVQFPWPKVAPACA